MAGHIFANNFKICVFEFTIHLVNLWINLYLWILYLNADSCHFSKKLLVSVSQRTVLFITSVPILANLFKLVARVIHLNSVVYILSLYLAFSIQLTSYQKLGSLLFLLQSLSAPRRPAKVVQWCLDLHEVLCMYAAIT